MATVISDRRYTPNDLLTLPEGDRFELVDGQLVGTEMRAKASRVAARIIASLIPFVESNQLGSVFSSDASYRCFGDAEMVRRPDVSYISTPRWRTECEEGHIPIPPDLAIEVVSPNDLFYDVQEKVEQYLIAGVKLVWVVNPEKQIVQVYHPDRTINQLGADDELSGESLLPGFRCSLAELFKVPPMSA